MIGIEKVKGELKKYKYVYVAVFFIFVLGVFLRVYNFSDLLVIKSDQARDALIIDQVRLNGIEGVPLVGPQIGGTELKMGPIFYYFQIFSGKIFQFSLESLAYPDLFFGILTILLSFLFFRKFFILKVTLFLTALVSVSLFLVTFSRFAWNPNSLPFFTFLFGYSFLRLIEENSLKRWFFLFLSALSIGIIAQLHLFAILSLIFGLLLFLIVERPLNYKEIFFLLAIILFLHTPFAINEIRTKGEGIKHFYQAKEKKEVKDGKHEIHELIFRAYQENSKAMWIIITGNQNPDIISTKGVNIVCNQKCRDNLIYSLLAMVIFGYSLVTVFYSWIIGNFVKKKELLFMILWMVSFLIFSVVFAYQLEIRFYLGVIPLFLFLVGFISEHFLKIFKEINSRKIIWVTFILLIFLNFYATFVYLRDLSDSRFSNEKGGGDLRFENDYKVTLSQLRDIAKEVDLTLNKEKFLVISGETHYVKSVYYILSREYGFKGCYLRGNNHKIDPSFNQVVIQYNKFREDDSGKNYKKFGTLKASFFEPGIFSEDTKIPDGCIDY